MATRIYSTARWARLRRLVLVQRPWCAFCELAGVLTIATVVDHKIPVRERPDLAFEEDNLQPLCKPCHDGAKQQQEKTGRVAGCDAEGIPLAGWE